MADVHSFNIPIKGGVIQLKTPFFKWYAYTGISNRINTRTFVTFRGQELKFKSNELGLRSYNLDWNLGTQIDVGWLNIDLYYGLGLTNSAKYGVRTNSSEILLNLGFLF